MIATHNGTFHCDEALACFMLKKTEKYRNADIVRTRDEGTLETADVVVDVGGVYDPERDRYDHHQRGFAETFSDEYDIKLSSAGLVYKHFGREVVRNVSGMSHDDPHLEEIYQRMYKKFVLPIDAIDNGISMYDGEPKYTVNTGLGSRVSALNPDWNENANPDERFSRAVGMVGQEFTAQLLWYINVWRPARRIVQTAFDNRSNRRIMVLPQFCPWGSHLRTIEDGNEDVLYVIWSDSTSDTYRIRAVAKSSGSFENRKSLPVAWRGKRNEALDEVTGIPGGVFVHANGFIGGHKTLEGAIRMASVSAD